MNINPQRLQELMEVIVELDDNRQRQLLVDARKMLISQSIEQNANSQQSMSKQDLTECTRQHIKQIADAKKIFDKMSDEEKAVVLLKMNEVMDKQLAVKYEVSVGLSGRQLNGKDYVDETYPYADYAKVIGMMRKLGGTDKPKE